MSCKPERQGAACGLAGVQGKVGAGGRFGKSGCRRRWGEVQAGEQGESSGRQGELGVVSWVKEQLRTLIAARHPSLPMPGVGGELPPHHYRYWESGLGAPLVGRCPAKR